MLQSSFQLHGAGLLMKRPWRTIGWLEAMRRCVESHVEEGHTVSRERRGFPFMAATSSSDSARRSLSSERTRDLVSYDLLFTPCHPEIRDKFDMGYCATRSRNSSSIFASTSSCAPRVFRRASQSGAAGPSVPRAAVRVVSKYPPSLRGCTARPGSSVTYCSQQRRPG